MTRIFFLDHQHHTESPDIKTRNWDVICIEHIKRIAPEILPSSIKIQTSVNNREQIIKGWSYSFLDIEDGLIYTMNEKKEKQPLNERDYKKLKDLNDYPIEEIELRVLRNTELIASLSAQLVAVDGDERHIDAVALQGDARSGVLGPGFAERPRPFFVEHRNEARGGLAEPAPMVVVDEDNFSRLLEATLFVAPERCVDEVLRVIRRPLVIPPGENEVDDEVLLRISDKCVVALVILLVVVKTTELVRSSFADRMR